MLDTNVLIDIVREPDGSVAAAFENRTLEELAISPVVSGEVTFGMEMQPDARANPAMAALLRSLRVDVLRPPADAIYGKLRSDLRRRGKALSPNDYWIAAQVLSRDAILVTSDSAFYEAGVEGLRLENWRSGSHTLQRN